MRRFKLTEWKTTVGLLAALLSLVLMVLLILRLLPTDDERLGHSQALLEYSTHYEIGIDGEPLFYMDDYDHWLTARISVNGLDIPTNKRMVTGVWTRPRCAKACRC